MCVNDTNKYQWFLCSYIYFVIIWYYIIFLYLFFFFKEILVQDLFFSKYSVNHTSFLNWILCLPTSDDELEFDLFHFIFQSKKRLSVRFSKNKIDSFQFFIFKHQYFFNVVFIAFRWSHQECLFIKHFTWFLFLAVWRGVLDCIKYL